MQQTAWRTLNLSVNVRATLRAYARTPNTERYDFMEIIMNIMDNQADISLGHSIMSLFPVSYL